MTTFKVYIREGSPSSDDLEALAHRIGLQWRRLGRRLGIMESVMDAIDREHRHVQEKAYHLLLHWRQQNGSGATYRVLYNALSHSLVSRRDLAEEVCLSDASAEALDQTVPPEIRVQGREAVLAFQNALRHGNVKVNRGRLMMIGQERAGKTSLKKSLVGIPFDPHQDSTVGIEVDPSKFEVEVDQIKNWELTELKRLDMSEFSENIAKMVARRLTETQANQDFLIQQDGIDLLADSSLDLTQQEDADIDLDVDNTANLQQNVMRRVVEYLKRLKLEDDIKPEEYILSLWDFAGQHLYYASHPVFMSHRALYILVCNLSKDFDQEAEPYFVQGVNEKRLENPNSETNLDNLLSWLVSLHNIRPITYETDKEVGNESYLRPPVFIVGTHADKPAKDVKEMIQYVQENLTGKAYQEHVIRPLFSVDNKKSPNDEGVQALREKILEVLKQEPYMKEELPIRWLHFEKIVESLVKKETYHVQLQKLEVIIRKVCRIQDKKEVEAMLGFYHNLGVIVKHGSTVVLQAQWLIDLFKQLITVPPFDQTDRGIARCWEKLEKHGILGKKLIDHVFDVHIKGGLKKEDILNLMELYGLIAKFSPDSKTEETRYFVPAQLTSPPPQLREKRPSSSDPCLLYLTFPDGFVPHGLFPQLLSRCIVWCSKRGFQKEPNLYQCGARFFIGKQPVYCLVLICRKGSIKVVLTQIRSSKSSKELEPKEVWIFLDETLVDLSEKLPWLRNLKYEWCVACTVCRCVKHKLVCCVHEECLHLHPVQLHCPEVLIICEKSYSDEEVKVLGLDKWFQVTKKCEVLQGDMASKNDPPEINGPPIKINKDLPKKSEPWEDVALPIDILLLTVKDCEFLSCLSFLLDDFFRSYHERLGKVYFGNIGDERMLLKIAVIKCEQGSTGSGRSTVVVKNAVEVLRPRAVFCAGFCVGLDRNKVNLGDVVVSAKLITYAATNQLEDGIQERGFRVLPEQRIAKLITDMAAGWQAPLRDSTKLEVTVHRDGVFLSGPELVDNSERSKELVKRFPEAIAIEMEGEGLFAAAHDVGVPWIIIKGVSDFADGKKKRTNSWRPFASAMAASVVANVLNDSIVFRNWPHYGDEYAKSSAGTKRNADSKSSTESAEHSGSDPKRPK